MTDLSTRGTFRGNVHSMNTMTQGPVWSESSTFLKKLIPWRQTEHSFLYLYIKLDLSTQTLQECQHLPTWKPNGKLHILNRCMANLKVKLNQHGQSFNFELKFLDVCTAFRSETGMIIVNMAESVINLNYQLCLCCYILYSTPEALLSLQNESRVNSCTFLSQHTTSCLLHQDL